MGGEFCQFKNIYCDGKVLLIFWLIDVVVGYVDFSNVKPVL